MKEYSVFDVLGPVMIGPSSSHTAGAAKLGKLAAVIISEKFKYIDFHLHGSFAKTYKGHGTDRALVAGIMGMDPDDENLKYSLRLAQENQIGIKFIEDDLGYVHPNTVKFVFKDINEKIIGEVTGSSIGGGNVVITNINGNSVEITGNSSTLIINQIDKKGVIGKITTTIASNNINIATMKVSREGKGKRACMIIEVDSKITSKLISDLNEIQEVLSVKAINI